MKKNGVVGDGDGLVVVPGPPDGLALTQEQQEGRHHAQAVLTAPHRKKQLKTS
jgi:hypothetical protein